MAEPKDKAAPTDDVSAATGSKQTAAPRPIPAAAQPPLPARRSTPTPTPTPKSALDLNSDDFPLHPERIWPD